MKKAYVLQTGSYNRTTDNFVFYDIEVFSSRNKLEASVENRMVDVNKGYDIEREDLDLTSTTGNRYAMISYKCLSTDGIEMQVRYLLKVIDVQ